MPLPVVVAIFAMGAAEFPVAPPILSQGFPAFHAAMLPRAVTGFVTIRFHSQFFLANFAIIIPFQKKYKKDPGVFSKIRLSYYLAIFFP